MGEKQLRYVFDVMGGADRPLYASDFPHEPPPDDIIGDIPEFPENPPFTRDEKRWITGSAAKRFYRLE